MKRYLKLVGVILASGILFLGLKHYQKRQVIELVIQNRLDAPVVFDVCENSIKKPFMLLPNEIIRRDYHKKKLKDDVMIEVKRLQHKAPHKRVLIAKGECAKKVALDFVLYDGGYADLRLRRSYHHD